MSKWSFEIVELGHTNDFLLPLVKLESWLGTKNCAFCSSYKRVFNVEGVRHSPHLLPMMVQYMSIDNKQEGTCFIKM